MDLRFFTLRSWTQKFYLAHLVILVTLCASNGGCARSSHDRIQQEAEEGNPIIRVGDVYIYSGYIDILRNTNPNFEALYSHPAFRQQIISELVAQEQFIQYGRDQGVFKDNKRLQQQLWLATRAVMQEELIRQEVAKRTREYYDKNKAEQFSSREIADIVYLYPEKENLTEQDKLRVLDRARRTKERLTAENFDEIAKGESEDPIGRAMAGQIGPVSYRDSRVLSQGWRPLIDAVFRLKVGEISEPIPTKEGVHIITPVAENEVMEYDKAEGFIRIRLAKKVKNHLRQQLAQEYSIEFLDPSVDPEAIRAEQEAAAAAKEEEGSKPASASPEAAAPQQ